MIRSEPTGVLAQARSFVGEHPGAFRALLHALVIACVLVDIYLIYLILRDGGFIHDSRAFWAVNVADPYTADVGERAAFLFSPAAAQVFAPLGLLPWPVFLLGWTVLQVAIVVWLAGRAWWWVLPLPPVLFECIVGSVHLLYAAAIVLGFRYPVDVGPDAADEDDARHRAALVRGPQGVAGAGHRPGRHRGHRRRPRTSSRRTCGGNGWTCSPRSRAGMCRSSLLSGCRSLARVAIAAVIVAWGAWTDRPWVLPIAVLLAQPVIWIASLSILVGILPLRGAHGRAIAAQSHGRGRAWYQA